MKGFGGTGAVRLRASLQAAAVGLLQSAADGREAFRFDPPRLDPLSTFVNPLSKNRQPLFDPRFPRQHLVALPLQHLANR